VLVSSCTVSCSAQLSVWLRQQNYLTADEIFEPQFNLLNNGSIGTAVEFESAGAVVLDELVIFEDFIVVHRFQDGILHEAAHHIFPRLVFERGDLPRSARDDDLEVLVDALDTLSSECSEHWGEAKVEVFRCLLLLLTSILEKSKSLMRSAASLAFVGSWKASAMVGALPMLMAVGGGG
jgi:hypothetical protein